MRSGMSLLVDQARYASANECAIFKRLGEHERALFVIDDIFIRNRVRSVLFMAQAEYLIDIKKESLNDLG